MKITHSLLLVSLLISPSVSFAQTPVWFEVASSQLHVAQSFLLPLSDPAQIALARQRLREGDGSGVGSIVVARAQVGGDGLNRNLRAAGQPRWSWQVTELLEFADLTIELCDGSPQLLQDDPAGFLANTDGVICFWGYTLAAELPAPPRMGLDDAVDGFWHDPDAVGTGFAIDVLEDQQQLALAWFRYTADPASAPMQQWLVGLAELSSVDAEGWIRIKPEVPSPLATAASEAQPAHYPVRLRFLDCNLAELELDHPPFTTHRLLRTANRADCSAR